MSDTTANREQLEDFVRENYGRAVRYCARLTGSPEDGEEIAQTGLLKLLRLKGGLSQFDSPMAWFYRVLRNVCIDTMRKNRRLKPLNPELEPAAAPSASHGVEHEEVRELLEGAVDGLDALQREAVILRFFEGLPLSDVAAAMERSVGAVAMLLSRAKLNLRAALSRMPEFADLAADGGINNDP